MTTTDETRVPQARTRWWIDALALLGLLALALAAVLPVVLRGLPFSVYDEWTHLDYALRAGHFEVPARGDEIRPEILDAWECYGTQAGEVPACGADVGNAEYPAFAQQYNYKHPPIYYIVTGLAARAVQAVTPLDFVTAARTTGVLWMFAGMAVLWLGMRMLGIGRLLAFSLAAAAGLWWTNLTAFVHVTNDAPALLAAGGVVLSVVALRRRWRLWWLLPILVAGLAASTKIMNALVVMGLAGALLLIAVIPAVRPAGVRVWQLLVASAGSVAAVFGVQRAWGWFQGRRGDPDWVSPITGQNGQPFPDTLIEALLRTAFRGFVAIGHDFVGPTANPLLIALAVTAVTATVIAVPWIALAVGWRDSSILIIATATVLGLLAWPTIAQSEMLRVTEWTEYFPAPNGRYGLSVPPLVAPLLGMLAAGRLAGRLVAGAALVLCAVTLIAVWFPQIGT